MIPVTEQCSAGCPNNGGIPNLNYRANSWHIADSGVQLARRRDLRHRPPQRQGRLSRAVHRQQVSQPAPERFWLSYRVNNGVPNQLTMTAGPAEVHTHVSTGSFYVQDQWTSKG